MAEGAEKFAQKEGFERKNMLTDRAKAHYRKRVKELKSQELKPYSGHDTVGMACLDNRGGMTAATSTSGLFMKKKGRVGDSPHLRFRFLRGQQAGRGQRHRPGGGPDEGLYLLRDRAAHGRGHEPPRRPARRR